jgi:excisionase family DNA binding protein
MSEQRRRIYIPTGNPRGRPRKARVTPETAPAQAPPATDVLAMRVADAARAIGVSRSKMKRMVHDREVRSVLVGRMRLIPVEALHELLGG